MNARALIAALSLSIFAPAIAVAGSGTMRVIDDISSEYLVTNAGKVLNLPSSIEVVIDYDTTLGRVTVSDWTARKFCSKYGPSPNGEPEMAECEEESIAWGPKLSIKTDNTVVWKIGDLADSTIQTEQVDLTSCVRDYEKLEIIQPTKPVLAIPSMILKKDCLGYVYVGTIAKKVSKLLKGATVDVEIKFGNFLKFNLPTDLIIDAGRVMDADQNLIKKSISFDPSYTQVIFDPLVSRRGQTIRLFNYPEVVYFR